MSPAMATPALIAESTIRFLRAHVPFSRMARGDLEFIAERVRLAYFPGGHDDRRSHRRCRRAPAHHPARPRARPQHLQRIGRGSARARRVLSGRRACRRGGRCKALRGDRGRLLLAADARRLRVAAPAFPALCRVLHARSSKASCSSRSAQLRHNFSQRAVEQRTLLEPLRTLVRREPVHCETGTAVRDALRGHAPRARRIDRGGR